MTSFLDRMLGRTPKGSSSKAKERLQFVLVHDRINLPPERLDQMKAEILAVISKYVSVDDKKVDIALQQRDRDSLLVAEIPFSKRFEDSEHEDDDDLPVVPHKPEPGSSAATLNATPAPSTTSEPGDEAVKPPAAVTPAADATPAPPASDVPADATPTPPASDQGTDKPDDPKAS